MKCREIGSNPFQCRDAYFGWKEWKKFRHNFVNPAFSAFLSWAAAMLCCHAQPITTTFLKRRITLYRCSCDAKKCLGGCQHLRMPVYTAWNGKIFFTFDFWEIFEIHWHILIFAWQIVLEYLCTSRLLASVTVDLKSQKMRTFSLDSLR